MLAYLNSETEEVQSFAKWEDFVDLIPVYYQTGTNGEGLPIYARYPLSVKPPNIVPLRSCEYEKLVKFIQDIFKIETIVLASGKHIKPSPIMSLSEDVFQRNAKRRASILLQYTRLNESNLGKVVNFTVSFYRDCTSILLSGANCYNTQWGASKEDEDILLQKVRRVYAIDTLLSELE